MGAAQRAHGRKMRTPTSTKPIFMTKGGPMSLDVGERRVLVTNGAKAQSTAEGGSGTPR